MEQVKQHIHEIKSFILHHKTISLFICGIILLDISLLGVISDMQINQPNTSTSSRQYLNDYSVSQPLPSVTPR
jgi:hypothetical protein